MNPLKPHINLLWNHGQSYIRNSQPIFDSEVKERNKPTNRKIKLFISIEVLEHKNMRVWNVIERLKGLNLRKKHSFIYFSQSIIELFGQITYKFDVIFSF